MNESEEVGTPVGVIGLGLLGSAIVDRLRGAGFRVLGHDLDAAKASALGVGVFSSARDVAVRVERIVLCLPDSDAVEDVVEGGGGLLEPEGSLRLIVDTTTGDPERSRALASRLRGRGVAYMDASVSGSSQEMREGRATLLVGGAAEDVEAARDLLDAMASVTYHLGEVGAGLRMKLVTNLLLGLQRLALAESLVLGERLGLSGATLLEVLRAGPAYARVIDTKGPKMVRGDYRPQARLAQHLKDVRLMLEQARRAGAELPATRLHREILERGIEAGHGGQDNSVVLEILRELQEES